MLTVENLVAGYGKVQVLHGLTMQVPQGKLVTLIGSNGAGKTTTLRALSGMIQPSAGRITLGGADITGLPSHAITRRGLAHSPEGRRVFATIARLKAAHVTMLLVEQFAAAALEVADYGYVLENGRLSASGDAAQLKNDPAVRAAYLGAAH